MNRLVLLGAVALVSAFSIGQAMADSCSGFSGSWSGQADSNDQGFACTAQAYGGPGPVILNVKGSNGDWTTDFSGTCSNGKLALTTPKGDYSGVIIGTEMVFSSPSVGTTYVLHKS
jgi:hypothetical protein